MAQGILVKLAYASGIIPFAMVGTAVRSYISFLYTDILGLSPNIAGLSWTLFCIVAAITEPYCGFYSDRSKPTKFGKHLPWVLFCFIPWLIVGYIIWQPPESMLVATAAINDLSKLTGDIYLGVFYTVVLVSFGALSAATAVNYQSAFTELFDESQRPMVTGIKQAFAVVGTIIGLASPSIIAKQDWSGRSELASTLTLISAPILIFFLLVCIPNVVVGDKQEAGRKDFRAFIESVSYAMKNRMIFLSCLIGCVLNLAFSYLGSSTSLWSKYVLGIHDKSSTVFGITFTPESQNAILPLGMTVSALLFIPVSLGFANKYGNETVFKFHILMCGVCSVFHLMAYDFASAAAIRILLGISCSGLFVLPEIFLAEAIEQDRKATGVKRSGIIYGTMAVLIHSTSIFIDLGKAAIQNVTGYEQPTASNPFPQQTDLALFGIKSLVSVIPTVLLLSSILILNRRKSAKLPSEKRD